MNNPVGKPFTTNFTDVLSSHNCLNFINEPTHIAGNTLDLVIHHADNTHLNNLKVYHIATKFSDHAFISFNYNLPMNEKVIAQKIKFRNYKNLNLNELESNSTEAFSTCEFLNPNELVDHFNCTLSSLRNNFFPCS